MDRGYTAHGRKESIEVKNEQVEWRQDYRAMQNEMFFGKVPTFDEILGVVGDFQTAFNKGS